MCFGVCPSIVTCFLLPPLWVYLSPLSSTMWQADFVTTSKDFGPALRRYFSGQADLPPLALVLLGALVGLTSFILLVGYEFQRTVRLDVLNAGG